MKCISFILILLCLCYQTKQQVVASTANIYALQTNTAKVDKYISKNEEGGIVNAQQGGTIPGMEIFDDETNLRYYQQIQAEKAAKAKQEQQVAILTYGSIGIVLLFIIIAIAAFSILYVRRNKDNPKYHKP